MVDNSKLEEIDVDNCLFYYLNNVIFNNDLFLKNIKIDKRSNKNVLPAYCIDYKISYDVKPLHTLFS